MNPDLTIGTLHAIPQSKLHLQESMQRDRMKNAYYEALFSRGLPDPGPKVEMR